MTGKFFSEKNIIVAAVIYFLVSGIILYQHGIQLGGEAEKYIDNANRILHRQELRNGFFGIFYFSYSLIVSFFINFSINLVFVAVLQVLLSFIAALSIYRLLLLTLQNRSVSFLFFCAYLLCYPVQKWNFFLYSESIHTSFLVIAVYLFYKAISGNKTGQWIASGLAGLAVLFSRPVGIIFLVSTVLVLIIWLYKSNKNVGASILALIFTGAIIGLLNSPVTTFINPDSVKRMEIICQVPETNADSSYREFNHAGLYKVYTVIKDEVGVGKFMQAGIRKLGFFFGQYRGYYSWQNNLLLLLFCIFYPFALVGIFSQPAAKYFYIKWLSVFYVGFTSITIFFTCDDWANRFISPVFPFILLLAAGSYEPLRKIVKGYKK
jgi:hypothetical protein